MGWGVLGCRPNTTGLRVAGGMPGKPKRIRGCYTEDPGMLHLDGKITPNVYTKTK